MAVVHREVTATETDALDLDQHIVGPTFGDGQFHDGEPAWSGEHGGVH